MSKTSNKQKRDCLSIFLRQLGREVGEKRREERKFVGEAVIFRKVKGKAIEYAL
jgi:hypothetical protein